MPPGTSDVLLTVFQSLPVDGIVTVSAPQELVAMIVGKAVNLAHDMNVELLGLVENMAYFECPDCGKRHHIFGDPQGAAVAERYDIPAYAKMCIRDRHDTESSVTCTPSTSTVSPTSAFRLETPDCKLL